MNYVPKEAFILVLFALSSSFSQGMDSQNNHMEIDTRHTEENHESLTDRDIIKLFCRLCDYFPVEIVSRIGNLIIGNCLDYHNMAISEQHNPSNFETESLLSSPDNKIKLMWNEKGAVLIDKQTMKVLYKFKGGHTDYITSGAFSPNGKYLLTCSKDNTGCLWNISAETLHCKLKGHTSPLTTGNFSRDNTTVLTCSKDLKCHLWDVKSGQLLSELNHPTTVLAANFLDGGKTIHTKLDNNTSYLWKTIPCEATQFIIKHSRFLQAWFIVQASKTKRAFGKWEILSGSIERRIFATFPEVVRNYIVKHYSMDVVEERL